MAGAAHFHDAHSLQIVNYNLKSASLQSVAMNLRAAYLERVSPSKLSPAQRVATQRVQRLPIDPSARMGRVIRRIRDEQGDPPTAHREAETAKAHRG